MAHYSAMILAPSQGPEDNGVFLAGACAIYTVL